MLRLLYSDRAVMRKVLGGNQAAFRVLVDRYGGAVHGVAYARLRNSADAEDVAQETFLRLYQQLDQMAHRKHVGSWLLHVARNVSVDTVRRRLCESECLKSVPAAGAAVPDPMREEMHRLLWSQIERLDPEAQELLVLHYFLKKKAREIAVLLDITTNTAEKRLQRAREELGRQLTEALGNEVEELRVDARRSERIMAAVCATPVAWKASAAAATGAATAVGVATGAGAAKVSTALACAVVLAVLGYLLYHKYAVPFSTQDITQKSTVTVADTVPAKVPRVNRLQETDAAEEPAPDSVRERLAAPVIPKVYGVLRGTVRNANGTPAAGAEVWVDNENEVLDAERTMNWELVEPVRLASSTDSSGRYRIEGLPLPYPAAYYVICASKGGFFAQTTLRGKHYEREFVKDVTLLPDKPVGGVVKGEGGRPVEGALVRVEQEVPTRGITDGRTPHTTTEADGRFVIDHLPPGSVRLGVIAEGYVRHLSSWLATGATDHVLQLDSGSFVSGRIVDVETGQGVGNMRISGIELRDGRPSSKSIGGKSDSTGAFRITGCMPATYELSVGAERPETTTLTLVQPLSVTVGAQPVAGLELKVATGGVLRGRVIDDETGLAVAEGCRVWAGLDDGRHWRDCRTGPDGAYELRGLHEGELTVRVSDSTGRVKRYTAVTLRRGEVKENYDIHLSVRPFGGMVVDESGKPVPGASVYAVAAGEASELASTISDSKGRFRFDVDHGKTAASVMLQAMTADAYSPQAGPFQAGVVNDEIVLRIIRSGRLEGDVVDQNGRPVQSISIAAMPESAEALIPVHNIFVNASRSIKIPLLSDNNFLYARLHPGKYTLEVHCPWTSDRSVAATDVMVEAGKTTTAHLVVDMSEFGEIEGVVLADGKPVSGQIVQVERESSDPPFWVWTGADGSYRIPNVLPGRVKVTATPQYRTSGRQLEQTAEVVSGEVTTVNFDLSGSGEATGSLEGYVMSGGAPVHMGTVIVRGAEPAADGGAYTATVDYQGWYKIEQIPQGNYVAEAALDAAHQTVSVHVAGGQTTRVDIELATGAVRGVVSGLREGEKAFVMLFPGDAYLSEWTLAAMEALSERMLNRVTIDEDGPFSFAYLNPGDYIVGVVAVPATASFEAADLIKGRVAVSDVLTAGPDAPAEVDLVIE